MDPDIWNTNHCDTQPLSIWEIVDTSIKNGALARSNPGSRNRTKKLRLPLEVLDLWKEATTRAKSVKLLALNRKGVLVGSLPFKPLH